MYDDEMRNNDTAENTTEQTTEQNGGQLLRYRKCLHPL